MDRHQFAVALRDQVAEVTDRKNLAAAHHAMSRYDRCVGELAALGWVAERLGIDL